MKFQLFDESDLKQLEDTLVKALVRAMRVIAREGSVTGWKPPVETGPPRQAEGPPMQQSGPAVATAPPASPSAPAAQQPLTPPPAPRRTPRDVCKTVGDRPQGYIPIDDAVEHMTVANKQSARSMLGQWVLDEQIPAVIVANVKPPTKGLPGRLMVEKQAVIKRDKQREANSALAPAARSRNNKIAA